MKTTLNIWLIALLMAVGKPATAADSASAPSSALVNVVLVQVDTSPEAVTAKRFETGNWTFWDQAAPRLLARLEGDMGRSRATGSLAPEASLYGVRCAAASLDDKGNLEPLAEHLDGISKLTRRASLLVVWRLHDGVVFLSSLDRGGKTARFMLAILNLIPSRPLVPGVLGVSEAASRPPCRFVWSSAPPVATGGMTALDSILSARGIETLLNTLALLDFESMLRQRSGDDTLAGPAGAAILMGSWSALRDSPSLKNITQFTEALLTASAAEQKSYLSLALKHATENPNWVVQADKSLDTGLASSGLNQNTQDSVPASSSGGMQFMATSSIKNWIQAIGIAVGILVGGEGIGVGLDDIPQPPAIEQPAPGQGSVPPKPPTGGQTGPEPPKPTTEPNVSVNPGIVASTTGPGKRGGRGGGIKPPPSWRPGPKPPPPNQPKPGPKGGQAKSVTIDAGPEFGESLRDYLIRTGQMEIYPLPPPHDPTIRDPIPPQEPTPVLTTTWVAPGGILFSPELVIVPDTTGIVASTAEGVVAEIKGKAGGEMRDGAGGVIIFAKHPGSAKLFQVMAGRFHLRQHDIVLISTKRSNLALTRYYDSASSEESALGKGWTFQPFSLHVGQTTKTGQGTTAFGKRPVLMDNERGAEMAYQVEPQKGGSPTASGELALPQYKPVTSAYQPYLAAQTNGGYTVTFAHGWRAAFNADGRLEWMGMSESNRTDYVYESGRLAKVANSAGAILFKYDQAGLLQEAVAPDGKRVTYVVRASSGLTEVSGGVDGSFAFGYADDGRVSTVEEVQSDGKRSLVARNTYDSKGRMLSQQGPSGLWKFRYDDNIGVAVFTEPSGKEVSYYYDGKQQLLAYGSNRKDMTLFNYDVTGRIFQVATGELLNEPSGTERPKFKVTKMVTPEIPNPEKPAGSG